MKHNPLPNLQQLRQQEKKYPNDHRLLSQIALYYLQNPNGNQDLVYFKKAYHAYPCVTTMHNLAFWALNEYGDELADELYPQILALKPKSFYPYMAYAEWLIAKAHDNLQLDLNKLQKLILVNVYTSALEKFKNTPLDYQSSHHHELVFIKNNLAVALAYQGNYHQAWQYFADIHHHIQFLKANEETAVISLVLIDEYQFHVLLNQARICILANDFDKARDYIQQATQNSQYDVHDIAELYAVMGDYEACYDIIKPELDTLWVDWDWIWYGVAQVDIQAWQQRLSRQIKSTQELLDDEERELAECNHAEQRLELMQSIEDYHGDLTKYTQRLAQDTPTKPIFDIEERLYRFYHCWLFGCQCHNNLCDDDNHWATNTIK